MIDKELIKKVVDKKSCHHLVKCRNCPVDNFDDNYQCQHILQPKILNPGAIRIMQEWLDSQEDK
jgi:hypothetical protein